MRRSPKQEFDGENERQTRGNRAQVGRGPKNGVQKITQDAACCPHSQKHKDPPSRSALHPPPAPSLHPGQCCFVEQNNRCIIPTYGYPGRSAGEVRALVNTGVLDTTPQEHRQNNSNLQNPEFKQTEGCPSQYPFTSI